MGDKIISISPDDGTYNALPAPGGSLSRNGEELEDTILGQSFQSTEAGLISWSISATARYKGFAGYKATVKKAGTSTSASGLSMSQLEGQTYMIDDFSKSLWDQSAAVTVYDNGTDVTSDVDNINHLFGQVTFNDSYTVTGPVTVDCSYLPLSSFGKAQSFNLTMTANTIDDSDLSTVQSNSGFRTYKMGLRTVSLDLSSFYDTSNEFFTTLKNRDQVIIELNPDGNQKSVARGFFRMLTDEQSGDVGAQEEESVTFNLNVQESDQVPFDWYHASDTTLNQAIVDMLNAWEDRGTVWAKYLPDGTNGYKGELVPTDVSLSSGLDSMAEFTCNGQGSGELTSV